MRLPWGPGLALLLALTSRVHGLNIPLEVEQPPTITRQSPSNFVAFPFDESFAFECEAKGNPEPSYRWTRDGHDFDPLQDPEIGKGAVAGAFMIPRSRHLSHYEGKYRCYASNKLGTAISEEITFSVPTLPKFPKEKIDPIVVEEGQPVVLECNPPEGIPPVQLYWMTIGLQHIDQDERVSMGSNGNLYFSNALERDTRQDYCCFAAFPRIRTIVQKTAMAVDVRRPGSAGELIDGDANVPQRKPSLLMPPGVDSEVFLVKGNDLELECIAEGFPTPQMEWLKMGEKLSNRTRIKNHGKLLTISAAGREDDGKYMCKAKNSAGETAHYFDVNVEEPPKWQPEPPKAQLSVVGSDVHIRCSASGQPLPAITWRRNGLLLNADTPSPGLQVLDDTLVLRGVTAHDSAVYQCEASNRHGTLLANVNILVANLPPLMLSKDLREYAAIQGSSAVMDCQVFSSPPSNISWSKVGAAEPVAGDRFSVAENGSLQIRNVRREDMAEYSCSASNFEGNSTLTTVLDVKDPTQIVNTPADLRILRGSLAQLSCQAEYDKSLSKEFEILWRKDEDDDETSYNFTDHSRYYVDEGILQILNVSHGDQGTYTCIAKTKLDRDSASVLITVLDVPDAPKNLVLSDHQNRRVHLSWEPGDDHNNSTTEFIVEFEENQWEPGRWRELLRAPGKQTSALLPLHGDLSYQFRVSAVNGIGRGQASKATERHKTPPAAPDRNPENIKIEGHLPHQMDINWEPLSPLEHNGPGLEYQLSYRRLGVDDRWVEQLVKRHALIVKDTPTFVPYEVKVRARNHHGWAPEPRVVTGYSGEDVPAAAPEGVAVEVINSTVIRVNWTRVPREKVHGHPTGYNVRWWRTRSLSGSQKLPDERESLMFPGNWSQGVVPRLRPFSEYALTVSVVNKRGSGPASVPVHFQMPEGVPEPAPILTATNAQKNSIKLVWAPPLEANGILTGYLVQYQLINDTLDVGDARALNVSGADSTQLVVEELQEESTYRFYLSACTRTGCGPALSEEGSTATEAREGSWRISEVVNSSKAFHLIEGLEPGTVYTVRLLSDGSLANSSLYEEVIKTKGRGLAGLHGGVGTQGWFIGMLCAVALLTLVALIACFVSRNKGGKYAVKEKEDLQPDSESQGMNDDTCEYSDSDEKPLNSSRSSADGGDSLGEYGDEESPFNEDGSFIGQYSGRRRKGSVPTPAPV